MKEVRIMAFTLPKPQSYQYQNVKVLYVENEVFSREKLLRVLKRRFSDVLVAHDGKEGIQLYHQHQPDIIIADIKRNQLSSLEMIEKIRSLNEKVQIIATTGHDDIYIPSIDKTINHFILKPIDLEIFLQAIQKSIYQIQFEKELSNMDPLMKCFNRLKFEEVLSSEIIRSERYDHHFSIILFDIDHFKKLNTYFGQQKGDDVLRTISTIVQQRIRESDIFARWGGDELILMTPETNSRGAAVLAESIRNLIDSFTFSEIGSVTCSFGIAEFTSGKSKQELIIAAEKALNQSKLNGRNCVAVYNS
jgi:diguanylate cyclase (GGDEF)-like protein